MKILHVLFITVVVSLGFSGCCIPPSLHTPQHPAVVLDYPPQTIDDHGCGILNVHLRPHCFSADASHDAKFYIDGKCHHFDASVTLKFGEHRLTFPPVAGFVTPPPTVVRVFLSATTKVSVTYNRMPHPKDGRQNHAHGKEAGAAKRASEARIAAVAALIDPTPGTISVVNQANGYLVAKISVVPGTPNPNSSHWRLGPTQTAFPYPYLNYPMGNGGTPTLCFDPLAVYNPPNPSPVALTRGKTTTVTVNYHTK